MTMSPSIPEEARAGFQIRPAIKPVASKLTSEEASEGVGRFPEGPGAGGRRLCRSAAALQGGGVFLFAVRLRASYLQRPLQRALLRSGAAPLRRLPPPPRGERNAGGRGE